MQSLTPNAVELIDYCIDGEEARHFSFRLLDPLSIATPQPGQFFMLHVPGAGAAPFTFTSVPDAQGLFRALIRRMHCAVGLCGHCYLEHQYACKDGPTYRWDVLQQFIHTH